MVTEANIIIPETPICKQTVTIPCIKGDKGDPLTYDDLTPEQIEELQRPAIEAAEKANTATTSANNAAQSANDAAAVANQAAQNVDGRASALEGKASQTYDNLAAIESSGETNPNKIYIDDETGQFYIYKNGQFVPSKGGDGSNKILDWNTDVATTRKQIPLSDRKSGLQISYNHPNYGWINEQYIGTSFTDSEWVKDYRWEKIVKFDFINGFNNFYSFLNYGIYNNSESKVRIKISESDEGGNFNISFSRNVAHYDDARIRVMDKVIDTGHSFSYTCDTKFTKQDTIYIYAGSSVKFQISLTPYLPTATYDSQIYSFICILFWNSLKGGWTIIDSNNIFCYDDTIVNSYNYCKRADIRMFGLSPYIEGISTENDKYDMAPQLNFIFQSAFNMGIKDLYFPSGIYYIGSTLRFNYNLNYRALRSGEVIFKKLDEDVSVSIEDNFAEGGYYGFVFENTYLGGFYNYEKTNANVVYDTIIINYPSFNNGGEYLFRRRHSDDKAHITFRNVKVNIQKTYVGFWVGSNTIIENCEFTGQATHVIRLDGVENCIVQNNYIYGNNCTTGIFFGSNRDKISRNINIKNNFVSGCTEECIVMDGFGNNAGLYPNLAQGNISSAYLDEKGLLVVEVYNLITPASSTEAKEADIPTLITKKDDVIFYFGRDTGIDGQYFSILSMEELEGNCKVILKTKGISTDKILTGDSTIIGFLTGFLDCNIDGNIIENSYGINDTATNAGAISLWLNIFGVNIINNRIIGTSRGIMVSGGSGLTGTYLYASNNLIANNKISGCKSTAIEVGNGYGGIFNYNNSVVNNTVAYCGGLILTGQRNLLFTNNMIKDTQINATYLDNTFISSNMFDGVTFTESNNGENYVKQNNFENS